MNKMFVGFGFGPIQSALFLFEAYQSRNFKRYVVAEIDQDLVEAVGNNNGRYSINIARKDRIDQFTLEGIELYNPCQADDRDAIIDAIGKSDEMATALPSVNLYDVGDCASVVNLLGQGISRGDLSQTRIIYAAENHNHAAEILHKHLAGIVPGKTFKTLEVLNTVIGKMSGVITESETIKRMGLVTITPDIPRAILVEEFNKILISQIHLPTYQRGIDVFSEKSDLLPFEEAKLYGHNAIHALIGYLADLKGLETMAEAGKDQNIMRIARAAFIDESGATLIRRHARFNDQLFTDQGYKAYADDLLERMANPNLNDLVWRVGRDHVRKLGYDDRLYGTIRLALECGLDPENLALGAGAGVLSMIKRRDSLERPVPGLPRAQADLSKSGLEELLLGIWGKKKTDKYSQMMIGLTWEALGKLQDQPV